MYPVNNPKQFILSFLLSPSFLYGILRDSNHTINRCKECSATLSTSPSIKDVKSFPFMYAVAVATWAKSCVMCITTVWHDFKYRKIKHIRSIGWCKWVKNGFLYGKISLCYGSKYLPLSLKRCLLSIGSLATLVIWLSLSNKKA